MYAFLEQKAIVEQRFVEQRLCLREGPRKDELVTGAHRRAASGAGRQPRFLSVMDFFKLEVKAIKNLECKDTQISSAEQTPGSSWLFSNDDTESRLERHERSGRTP